MATASNPGSSQHDFDYIVIGSGFGGSVSALRLAEKGYRVAVLECGARFEDSDFAEKTSDFAKYSWMPKFGGRGIMRLTFFKDVTIASGSGVGGGSLGYANTLYRAKPSFFEHEQWSGLAEWDRELAPHYDTAEKMLGVTTYEGMTAADHLLKDYAEELGVGETFGPTRVGVYFGPPGEESADPYFGGAGPDRTGCTRCGTCMIGCREGAKNTLRKNYLWFAEQLGVQVIAHRTVTDIRPLGEADGSDGYEVTSERSGSWFRKHRRKMTAGAVVVAAGALGTNKLLQTCKLNGSLPGISDQLGELVRTNSESILAVTAPDDERDFTKSIAITSSIYPEPDTHIETVTYGGGHNSLKPLYTLLTGDGTRRTRPLKWLAAGARNPIGFAKALIPYSQWSRRTIILLVMQTLDNAIRLRPRSRPFGLGPVFLKTEQDPENPNPTFIPAANQAAERIAERIGGLAQSSLLEAVANIPTTAHILGGAVIGPSPESGVVDGANRVYGYENLLVCDGAAMPANPGVNPSLTITAIAEHAMAQIPSVSGGERDSGAFSAAPPISAPEPLQPA